MIQFKLSFCQQYYETIDLTALSALLHRLNRCIQIGSEQQFEEAKLQMKLKTHLEAPQKYSFRDYRTDDQTSIERGIYIYILLKGNECICIIDGVDASIRRRAHRI